MQKIVKARFLCTERKFKTMSQHLLDIENLTVAVEDKEILHGVNLQVNEGETHVLMGPNGAGKSTLGYALMGNPQYKVTGGSILFHGKEQQGLSADQRAKEGMFLSFQNPLEVPGLSLKSFVRSTLAQRTGKRVKLFAFEKQFNAAAELLQMDPAYGDRDLNVGFSGGEKKKIEMLQLLLLQPKLAILDETDSGLDVDALGVVSRGIAAYREQCDGALIVITHNTRILERLDVDKTHVMVKGHMIEEGPASLISEIDREGFGRFERAAAEQGIEGAAAAAGAEEVDA